MDALQELQQDGQRDEESEVSPRELERELARPAAISDERLGAEAFDKLDTTIKGLDRDLRRLANVSRDLASSVGIVRSTNNFRTRLIGVRGLLRINAGDLYPTIEYPRYNVDSQYILYIDVLSTQQRLRVCTLIPS